MKLSKTLTASILALTLLAPAAFGDAVPVSVNASGLDFATKAAASMGYKLTVSGPDAFYAVESFDKGALPHFSTAGLADGYYKYELTAILDEPAGEDRALALKVAPLATGTFKIQAGAPVDTSVREGVATKDQVFIDDLIVQSSACVGFDCANGENFGSDTFRLKENNLRIHFDDTSSSASFPNNDWRLTANDSTNGGGNYFAIEDATAGAIPFRIEAGADANALYVDDAGRIGVGTANPVVNTHIVEGNTPTLRLEQDGSSGFTPQTWDLAGNEANFFVRDVTNSSKLPLKIKPGAPTDSVFVAADGDIGLSTASPDAALHVRRTDTPTNMLKLETTDTDAIAVGFGLVNPSGEWRIQQPGGSASTNPSAFVVTRVGSGDQEMALQTDGDLVISGTCLQIGTDACTVSAGTLSCSAGSC